MKGTFAIAAAALTIAHGQAIAAATLDQLRTAAPGAATAAPAPGPAAPYKAADRKGSGEDRIERAIKARLQAEVPEGVSSVTVNSVQVGPYPDGVSFPFSAATEETDLSGRKRRYTVFGIYNSVNGTLIDMGKAEEGPAAKPQPVAGA